MWLVSAIQMVTVWCSHFHGNSQQTRGTHARNDINLTLTDEVNVTRQLHSDITVVVRVGTLPQLLWWGGPTKVFCDTAYSFGLGGRGPFIIQPSASKFMLIFSQKKNNLHCLLSKKIKHNILLLSERSFLGGCKHFTCEHKVSRGNQSICEGTQSNALTHKHHVPRAPYC